MKIRSGLRHDVKSLNSRPKIPDEMSSPKQEVKITRIHTISRNLTDGIIGLCGVFEFINQLRHY